MRRFIEFTPGRGSRLVFEQGRDYDYPTPEQVEDEVNRVLSDLQDEIKHLREENEELRARLYNTHLNSTPRRQSTTMSIPVRTLRPTQMTTFRPTQMTINEQIESMKEKLFGQTTDESEISENNHNSLPLDEVHLSEIRTASNQSSANPYNQELQINDFFSIALLGVLLVFMLLMFLF